MKVSHLEAPKIQHGQSLSAQPTYVYIFCIYLFPGQSSIENLLLHSVNSFQKAITGFEPCKHFQDVLPELSIVSTIKFLECFKLINFLDSKKMQLKRITEETVQNCYKISCAVLCEIWLMESESWIMDPRTQILEPGSQILESRILKVTQKNCLNQH